MDGKSSDWRPGPTVCRCCLSEGCYKDISTEYFWMGRREVYSEMLSETLDLSIAYSNSSGPNSNSRLICEQCISRLRDASEFKRQVIDCEKTFMQHLNPGSSSKSKDYLTAESSLDVKVETVKHEKESFSDDDFDDRPDFLDVDSDDDLDNQPLTKLASKIPKKEAVDILDLLDASQITVKRKSNLKTKEPPKKVLKKKETKAAPRTVSKAAPKQADKKKGDPAGRISWKKKRKYYDHRDNAALILQYSNICPFRWQRGMFVCGICPRAFGKFDPVREHVTLEHPNRIEALKSAKHFVKCDITDLQCKICHASINDLNDFAEHLKNEHGKPLLNNFGKGIIPYRLNTALYECMHCPETFNLFNSLNTHINYHYPNSVCPICGKSFSNTGKMTFHMYAHGIGTTGVFKCSKCDQVFNSPYDKQKHVTSAHSKPKRYRCPHCHDSFKSYSHRLKHMNEFHDTNIDYPCGLCPAVFTMHNLRTKHIQRVHIKEKRYSCTECDHKCETTSMLKRHQVCHTGERKYHCNVCDKSYPRLYTLREHMRIHANDRRFICMHCNSAFIQKCSLKSHMKTHHPNIGPDDKPVLKQDD